MTMCAIRVFFSRLGVSGAKSDKQITQYIAYPFNILYDLFFLSTFSIIIIPNPRRTKDNKDNKDNKTNPLSFILIRTFKTFYKILLFCGDKGNFCQYTAIGETRSTFECQQFLQLLSTILCKRDHEILQNFSKYKKKIVFYFACPEGEIKLPNASQVYYGFPQNSPNMDKPCNNKLD